MIQSLYEVFIVFAVYSFLGWLLEVIFTMVYRGGFDNRGFLNGPACPIYGFGALATLFILSPFRGNFLAFFAGAVVLATVLELIVGFILDRVFREKWWDYTNEPLNFCGYICMKYSIFWGVSCTFLMYILHPGVMRLVEKLPVRTAMISIGIYYSLLGVDLLITLFTLSRITENIRSIHKVGAKIRKIKGAIGDNISGVSSAIKSKARRTSDLDELWEKYDTLIQKNKVLLYRLLQFFHPLARLIEKERLRRIAKVPASEKLALADETYYKLVENLLEEACVKEMQKYIQHGDTTTYTHCLAVSYYSFRLSRALPLSVDIESVVRGGLLHDLFLYDWHVPDRSHRFHGFYHPGFALRNANKYFKLNTIEQDIIKKHMWPLTITRIPRCRESVIVCLVDKACSLAETIGFRYKRKFEFNQVTD